MADKKITELPYIDTLSGSLVGDNSPLQNTVIPLVLRGTTNQINIENFSKFVTAYSAHTGSAGNTFTGPQTINNNVTINGRLTVREVVAQYETASILFSTGSTKLGDELTDKHEFTGSTNITGSFIVNGANLTNFSSSNSTTFTNYSSSVSANISSYSSSNSTTFTNLSSSNSTTFTNFSSSNSTTFTNYSSSTATSINGLSLGIGNELVRLYQTTASLNTQTGSQNSLNTSLGLITSSIYGEITSFNSVFGGVSNITGAFAVQLGSIDSHILTQATQTGSQDVVNLGISTFTGSQNVINSSVDSHILNISTYTSSVNVINNSIDSHILTQATQTGSQDLVNLGISSVTGSLIGITNGLMAFTAALDSTYATDAQLYQLYQTTASIHSTTQSLNTQTGSQDLVNLGISTFTGSLRSEVNGIEAYTASLKGAVIVSSSQQILNYNIFATTGSNTFIGNQTITGSLTVSGSNTFTNIGRTELTGSVEVDGDIGVYGNITVVQKTIEVLGFPTNQPAFYSEGDILLSGSLSIHVEELGQSFDVAEQFQQAFSSISFTQGELEIISSSYATTGSNIFVGNQSITGSLITTGGITGSLMATNGVVSSSQQITNYYKFAETASANTFYGNQTFASDGGTGLRIYGASGTHQWDVYLNGQNLRLSDNTVGDGAVRIDQRLDVGGHVTASGNLYIGGALQVQSDSAAITLKQTGTTAGTGIYLERSGEQKGYYMYLGGAVDSLIFQRNNAGTKADVLSLSRDGDVTVSTGNLIIGTSGKGIDFSATSNGSGTTSSELLNDYEEGTWSPQIYYQNATDQSNSTNVTQIGTYIKVGNVVTVIGVLQWTVTGSPVNDNIGIKNFPFTSKTGADYIWWGNVQLVNAGAYPTDGYILRMDNNTTLTLFYDRRSDAGNYGDDIGASGTKTARFTITYFT